MQNLVGIDSAITVLLHVFVWIFFMHLFVIQLFFGATGHSLGTVLTFNSSNGIFHNRCCLLGLFDIGAYLVVKSPNFVVFRHFPAKCAKYQNFHITGTTAPIPTKFCTMTKTTKYAP